MPALRGEWTTAMLDALPESSERYELVDGELLVTPGPSFRHQDLVLGLARALFDYVVEQKLGRAIISPADVVRGDPVRNRLQPDVFVISAAAMRGQIPPHPSGLLLAIEVVSPSSVIIDYQRKREVYLRDGLPEYWVVNAEARNLSRWTSSEEQPEVVRDSITWTPHGTVRPLTIDLNRLFDEAMWAG